MANGSSTRRTYFPPILRTRYLLPAVGVLILLAMATGLASRKPPLRIPINEAAVIRLRGAITGARPQFETHPWQAWVYRKLPGRIHDWVESKWPSKNEVFRWSYEPGQMLLFFQVDNQNNASQTTGSLLQVAARRTVEEESLKLRVRYGAGQYSQYANLNFSNSSHYAAGFCTAELQNVPHTLKELQVELVQLVLNGPEQIVYTGTIRNPLYEKLEPIGVAAPLPAEVLQEDVSVNLLSLGSRTPKQFNDLYDAIARGEHPPRHQLVTHSANTDNAFHHTAAIFLTRLRKFRQLPLGVDDVKLQYGKRGIPYELGEVVAHFQRETKDGLLQGFLFQNDVRPIGQPVKLIVQLAKRYGFTKEEIFSREVDMPPNRKLSDPKPLRVYGPLMKDIIGPHRERLAFAWFGNAANVPGAPDGFLNDGEFTVMVEDVREVDRLHSVQLIKPDGTTVDLQDYLLRLTIDQRRIWAAFDVKNSRGLGLTPPIKPDEYEKIRINLVCPQQFNVPFEFIAEADTPAVK